MPQEQNNWYDIKMKDGEVFEIDELQHTTVRKILATEYKNRPDFIFLGEGDTIKVDYIAYIKKEKYD